VQVRLVGGGSSSEGRLEVLYNGIWGTVCDDGFTITTANTVCRQLGYPAAIGFHTSMNPGVDPIWLDDVSCSGDETSIDQCDHRDWGAHDCKHSEDVAVTCNDGIQGSNKGTCKNNLLSSPSKLCSLSKTSCIWIYMYKLSHFCVTYQPQYQLSLWEVLAHQ